MLKQASPAKRARQGLLGFLLLMLIVSAGSGWIAGCGGGKKDSGPPAPTSARAQVTVNWGARSRSVNAPSSALSARITFAAAGVDGADVVWVVNRDGSRLEAYSEVQASPLDVKIGAAQMTVAFFAEPNAGGTVVGTASAAVNIAADGSGVGAVATTGTITSVEVLPGQALQVGEKKDILFTAKMADGTAVAVTPGSVFFNVVDGGGSLKITGGQAEAVGFGVAAVTASVDGTVSAAAPLTISDPSNSVVLLPPSGGTIQVPNVAAVTFPDGSFPNGQPVIVSATNTQETAQTFTETTTLFAPSGRSSNEVRINTGATLPSTPTFEVTLNVPADFLASKPADHGIDVFAQIYQESATEALDTFELMPSTFNATNNTVTVTLPTFALTNVRNADGSYEAILTFASTPGANVSVTRNHENTPPADTCSASAIGAPLGRALEVSGTPPRYFNPGGTPHPITGEVTPHFGVDLRADVGEQVLAVADGTIQVIGIQEKLLPNGKKTGWGHYIVIRHTDGSATLYAHLSPGSALLTSGSAVRKGQAIALSGESGGATGPHLHIEYAPNGNIFNNKNKIDPYPCIGSTLQSSITAGDNGSVADDSFTLYLNGLSIGTTTIGGSNSLAVGNLRPGTYDLRLEVTLAPDDIGTWFIQLEDGLTFENGGTYESDYHPEGTVLDFRIVVPATRSATRATSSPIPPNRFDERTLQKTK